MTPTKGLRFIHSRVLDAANRPQQFEVTRVARGTVYYRAVEGAELVGAPQCCDVEDFPRWCTGVVEK